MPEEPFDKLPLRWRDLDKRTIEFIARLNESERGRFIQFSHLDEAQFRRLDEFLTLPDDKWKAGFKIVTRSVAISNVLRKFPRFVLGLAAILVALDQIWARGAPYITKAFGK